MRLRSTLLLLIIGLSGCTGMSDMVPILDDAGHTHLTPGLSSDHWGREFFPEHMNTQGKKLFIYDPKASAWAAYSAEGERLKTGSASGGKDFCEDVDKPCRTITGSFRVYNKRGEDCRSGEYPVDTKGGARMPYCMYFYRGFTIHAAYEVPRYPSSHGCVRVWPSAAKWLNEEFMTIGTKVVVLSYPNDKSEPAA